VSDEPQKLDYQTLPPPEWTGAWVGLQKVIDFMFIALSIAALIVAAITVPEIGLTGVAPIEGWWGKGGLVIRPFLAIAIAIAIVAALIWLRTRRERRR
jgi:hypothetical protein